jgi:hypothetical protein
MACSACGIPRHQGIERKARDGAFPRCDRHAPGPAGGICPACNGSIDIGSGSGAGETGKRRLHLPSPTVGAQSAAICARRGHDLPVGHWRHDPGAAQGGGFADHQRAHGRPGRAGHHAGTTVAEESLGLDPDKLFHAALREVGLAGPDAAKHGQVQAAYGAASGQAPDKPAPAARTQGDTAGRGAGYAAYLFANTTPPGGMG